MYQRILVPVDGSAYSEQVLPYARAIARATGARLHLLRVVDEESERDAASRQLQALARDAGGEALVSPSSGNIAATLLAEAAQVPDTLIAMTSHGRSGLLNAMLGSVALDVVRTGHVPVLVYRPDKDAAPGSEPIAIRTVVLPLDGSGLSEWMQAQAAEWARALKANLLVVQAISPDARPDPNVPPNDALEHSYVRSHAVDLGREYGIEAGWEVLHGDPVESIARFLDDRRDVLIVMATRGRAALQAAVLGSVTSGLLHRAGVPIVMRAP